MIAPTIPTQSDPSTPQELGELYALLLRLHPLEKGGVSARLGRQLHAAFLDIVRQNDAALAEQLHQPNQRRPFTVGLLQGFNHLSSEQLEEARAEKRKLPVQPGQVYWLRVTMLDASVFHTFVNHLLLHPQKFIIRLAGARFEVSQLLLFTETNQDHDWVGFSSFTHLKENRPQRSYTFEFATPTAFSFGQKSWGKRLQLLPEPAYVFEHLAKQWEAFAPEPLRMATKGISPYSLAAWCEEQMAVARYALRTVPLPFEQFIESGFQGTISYEVKGDARAPEASWLSPLAGLALFCGIGTKTAMGMGQARCIPLSNNQRSTQEAINKEEKLEEKGAYNAGGPH